MFSPFPFSFIFPQSKDGAGDSSFPVVKDPMQFSVAHARYSKVLFWSCLVLV
jgi:hypothetical protein